MPPPPGAWQPTISLVLSVSADSFEESAFKERLAAIMPGVGPDDILVTVASSNGLEAGRRVLAGTITQGGAWLRLDVSISALNQYVADTGVSSLSQMASDDALSAALGVEVQILEPPSAALVFRQAPLPPPLPPERPFDQWALEYGTKPGALLIQGSASSDTIVKIFNSTFAGFDAKHGGALAILEGGWAIVRNCTFRNNEALYGGALYVRGGKLTLDHCTLEGNRASREGGALFIASGSALLGNGTILQDSVAPRGQQVLYKAGELFYYLPAPLGRWAPSSFLCKVARAPCRNRTCNAEDQPQLPVQQCNFRTHPELLGRTVAMLPLGAFDGSLPSACFPGYAASSTEPVAQSDATCSGRE